MTLHRSTFSSDSESSDTGCSELDEEYFENLPSPVNIENLKVYAKEAQNIEDEKETNDSSTNPSHSLCNTEKIPTPDLMLYKDIVKNSKRRKRSFNGKVFTKYLFHLKTVFYMCTVTK